MDKKQTRRTGRQKKKHEEGENGQPSAVSKVAFTLDDPCLKAEAKVNCLQGHT